MLEAAKAALRPRWRLSLLAELGDLMSQPRNFAACGVPVHLTLARLAHQRRLRALHRFQRLVAVAGGDRFLNLAELAAHARPARLSDFRAAVAPRVRLC